jgi:hypothetical protein
VRALIRWFDGWLRRAEGVFEFCDRPECILRLQRARAAHPLSLPDGGAVQRGDPVLMIHLWNERMPPIPADGPDLTWAAWFRRSLIGSYRLAAQWLAAQPGRGQVSAVGGVTVLLYGGETQGALRLIQRLGFQVMPYQSPLGCFGEFWENLYTWAIMWTFNVVSMRHRRLLRIRRAEIWMSTAEFMHRYG